MEVKLASEALTLSNQNNQINGSTCKLFCTMVHRKSIHCCYGERKILLRFPPSSPDSKHGLELNRSRNVSMRSSRPEDPSYQRAAGLLLEGKEVEARRVLTHDTFPRLLEHHAAFNEYAQFQAIGKRIGRKICVDDTGCGIPLAIQPHILAPCFTSKEVGKGTGQGLATAHAVIVNKHGGSIWFESKEGRVRHSLSA